MTHDHTQRALLDLAARLARLELQVEELTALVSLLQRDRGPS